MKFEYVICIIFVALFIYFVMNKESFSSHFENSKQDKQLTNIHKGDGRCNASGDLLN